MKKYNFFTLVVIATFSLQSSLMYTSQQITNPWGTDLHKAVWSDKLDEVQSLVANGANINAQDADGYTPLHRAVVDNFEEIVDFLITQDADFTIKDSGGWTPLHRAVMNNNIKIASILAEKGQSGPMFTSKNNRKITPLALAAWDDRVEMVQMLIDKGALDVQSIQDPKLQLYIKSPAMKSIFEQAALNKQQKESRKGQASIDVAAK